MTVQLTCDCDAPIHLLQLSDSHLMADKHHEFLGINPFTHLNKIINQLSAQTLDCVLSTGDLAQQPTVSAYHDYITTVERLAVPHFWIRGNHDDNHDFPKSAVEHEPLLLLGNWGVILLNSQSKHMVNGEIDSQDYDFIAECIAQHPQRHFIIAIHHPCFEVGSLWLDQHKLKHSQQFLDFIAQFKQIRLVLCGHVHQDFTLHYAHITLLSCPSTWALFEPKSPTFALQQHAPGYRLLTLFNDGRYTTQVEYLKDWQPYTFPLQQEGY